VIRGVSAQTLRLFGRVTRDRPFFGGFFFVCRHAWHEERISDHGMFTFPVRKSVLCTRTDAEHHSRCSCSGVTPLRACSFVSDMVDKLTEYSLLICGQRDSAPLDAAAWQALAESGTVTSDSKLASSHGSHAERSLHLLAMILDRAHGKNMPIQRPHHASARGVPLELNVAPSVEVPTERWPDHGMFVVGQRMQRSTNVNVHTNSAAVRPHALVVCHVVLLPTLQPCLGLYRSHLIGPLVASLLCRLRIHTGSRVC
jgi:hypothetical protein